VANSEQQYFILHLLVTRNVRNEKPKENSISRSFIVPQRKHMASGCES